MTASRGCPAPPGTLSCTRPLAGGPHGGAAAAVRPLGAEPRAARVPRSARASVLCALRLLQGLHCKVAFFFCFPVKFSVPPPSSRVPFFRSRDAPSGRSRGLLSAGNEITDLIFPVTRGPPCIILICRAVRLSGVTCRFHFCLGK